MSWQVVSRAENKLSPDVLAESRLYLQLYKQLYDARSLFRLLKSVFEIKRITIILQCINETDKFTLITNVLSRVCYFFYWMFDNGFIVTKILNRRTDSQGIVQVTSNRLEMWSRIFRRISRIWWLVGIVSFMVYCLKTLRKTYTDESDLKVAALDKMTVAELRQNLQIISKLRHDYWLNLVRTVSELMICLNENEIPINVLGKRLNNGVEGCFGMISSSIMIYSSLLHVFSRAKPAAK